MAARPACSYSRVHPVQAPGAYLLFRTQGRGLVALVSDRALLHHERLVLAALPLRLNPRRSRRSSFALDLCSPRSQCRMQPVAHQMPQDLAQRWSQRSHGCRNHPSQLCWLQCCEMRTSGISSPLCLVSYRPLGRSIEHTVDLVWPTPRPLSDGLEVPGVTPEREW